MRANAPINVLNLGVPRGKGSLSASKGPKPPIQLLQLLKNSPREVKRNHFRYTLGPPGPTQEMELLGPGGTFRWKGRRAQNKRSIPLES